MEQSKPNALLDHLAKKNTPGAAWQEYLKLRPAQAAEWLTGSPSLLQRMVGDYSMGGELATLLTTQLGADIWQQAQEGGTILSTLFAKRKKWRANHPDMAYLLLGMLAQAPEQNRSYWENARSHFMEVARKIEQSRVRQYPDARPKGVLRLLLDQQGTIPKIHAKPFENLGAEAKGWMRSHASQVWEGMDRDAGFALARQPDAHENTRRLWALALRHAIKEEFPAGAARETQVIVLVMSLGNGGGGGFGCTEQEASRILDGELSFPADVMDRLEHYLDEGTGPVHELAKTRLRKFKLDQMIDQDESTPARPRM